MEKFKLLCAAVSKEELQHLLNGKIEMVNGWCNRFLWCLVRRTKNLPNGGDASVLDGFRQPLASAIARAKSIGQMRRSADAESYWESLYPSLIVEGGSAYAASVGRARPIVVRLSMIYALVDGTPTIGVEHLRAALAVWRYCDSSARFLFDATATTSEVSLAERLFSLIIQTKGISRTEIHIATGKKFSADELTEALNALVAEGKVHSETEVTSGRPAEVWFAKDTSFLRADVVVQEIPVADADAALSVNI